MFAPYRIIGKRVIRFKKTSVQMSEISQIAIEDLPREEWHPTSFETYDNMGLIMTLMLSAMFVVLFKFVSLMAATVTCLIIGGLIRNGVMPLNGARVVPTARVDIILKNGEKLSIGNFTRSKADKIQAKLNALVGKIQ